MISVIMPAYNEINNITRTIEEAVKTLEESSLDYEVIVVDDGSNDGTLNKALSVVKKHNTVRAYGYTVNMGKGYALKYGYQFTQGDLVMFLDSDSDLPPYQIIRFLDYMNKTDADVVIGSKRHPLSEIQFPLLRRVLSRGYLLQTKLMFNLDISDTQVGMKLFRRKVLENIIPTLFINRYAFDLELLVRIHDMGYRIVEAPVSIKYQFTSHINLKDVWRMFVDTMIVFRRLRLSHFGNRK